MRGTDSFSSWKALPSLYSHHSDQSVLALCISNWLCPAVNIYTLQLLSPKIEKTPTTVSSIFYTSCCCNIICSCSGRSKFSSTTLYTTQPTAALGSISAIVVGTAFTLED
ncbi:hypothetical protein Naga_100318g4 [Nannochloropsis gaditana]|uniref:Uncharacterized protein n=1 Tax=Nannochloropsis gaditana TaxID=72520 RepID=W7TL64_9STRA|nr:hypothetical protein Naga_100318g4 [Nannochloropsis gaditana]